VLWGGEQLDNTQTTCQGESSVSWPFVRRNVQASLQPTAHQEAPVGRELFIQSYQALCKPTLVNGPPHIHTHTHKNT